MRIDAVLAARPARAVVELATSDLLAGAGALLEAGYRLALVAAHDDADALRVVYLFVDGPPDQRVEIHVRLSRDAPIVPSLAGLSFPAGRFEREMADLFGVVAQGHPQPRPLVTHQHWPRDWHPLRHDARERGPWLRDADAFPFAPVEGEGVYEIPVGPIHAGIIEPGHFRFWVVGETIIKMKARLWFTHKGVEKLFEGRTSAGALALAERISGDSAVGHSLAQALALEEALGVSVDADATRARALLLELERLYNHVADVGALCNDAAFSLAQARALTLRESLLRLNERVTGHRLLRGTIGLGTCELREAPRVEELDDVASRFGEIVALARANGIVMDRFRGTGVLAHESACDIGVLGVAARASGVENDARVAHPLVTCASYVPRLETTGDVMARFDVRVREVAVSLAMVRELLGASTPDVVSPSANTYARSGTGIVEGWRGTIVHRVEVNAEGALTRAKVVDPSFVTWPALSVALANTIVPDFPLVNKSFNLSYAGNDL